MDVRDFRVAAYLKSGGKQNNKNLDKDKKEGSESSKEAKEQQTGQVIHNDESREKLVRPAVFQKIDSGNKKTEERKTFSSGNSSKNEKKTATGSVISGNSDKSFTKFSFENNSFGNKSFGNNSGSNLNNSNKYSGSFNSNSFNTGKTEKKSFENNIYADNFGKKPLDKNYNSSNNSFIKNTFPDNNYSEKARKNKQFEQEKSFEERQAKKLQSQELEEATDYLKSGGLLKVPIKESEPGIKDSAYRKVAKFLVLIGEDEAAKVLPHLSESEIEKIIPEIASIRTVSNEEASVILEEFHSIVKKVKQQGGVGTAREMLVKAYGEKRAEEMLKKAMPFEGVVPFSYLKDLEKERIYLLIKDENVGVQSLVLSYLDPKKSASVINIMTDEEKKDVVMRLAEMEPVSPEVLRRVNQAMHEKSQKQTFEKTENIDGRSALANILKKMNLSSENEILTNLSEEDPDLGQDLRRRLFTLDDVDNADDKFIQKELRELSDEDIAYLVAGKPQTFKEKILSNISANRRAEVRAQDEINTVKRRSDVDKITNQFLGRLRQAFEDGDLVIHNRNDEEFV